MKLRRRLGLFVGSLIAIVVAPATLLADTIDPTSFATTLAAGESTTIRKTVVVEEGVTSGLIDVMFLIDTSGSMGGAIAGAKAAAADILTGLAGFGNLASGTGYYSEPGSDGVFRDLTTDTTTGLQNINDINLLLGGGGGDFPEEGINATYQAADGASWRPGSNRFIIALGDATFKESDGISLTDAQTALADNNVTFIGIDFANMTRVDFDPFTGIDPTVLATASGGSIVESSTSSSDIVDAIVASVTDAFASYTTVGVSDLGAGLPGVGVSVTCVSAAAGGSCTGATATGSWDRSESRTFEFDVTFTGLAEGTHGFDTHALVDGGIVASEADRIVVGAGTVTPVSEPGTLALLGLGLVGLALGRRART